VEKVAKDLKNKLSAGIDDIPDYVAKRCIWVLKKPLNIYNASLKSGIFPDQLKVAKVGLGPVLILLYVNVPHNIETEFLGICINENMKWSSHIKYLSSKLSTSHMINSLKNVMSSYISRSMYFVCCHVHLRYGLTLWGGDPESIMTFRIQKKGIRIIGLEPILFL
jgi:hypothetical protein